MTPQQLKNSILQRAIEGKLVEQRPEEGTAKELLKQIKAEKDRLVKEGKIKKTKPLPPITEDEIPFEIPESWEWVRLGVVFFLQAGKNIKAQEIASYPDKKHEFMCYGGNGIRGYVAQYNQEGNYPLIGRQGALCGNIHLAQGKFYATEHAVVTDTFAGTDVIWAKYFLVALNLNQYATATAQPGLAVNKVEQVLIPLPPLPEQHRIVAKIEELMPLVEEYGKVYEELAALNKKFPADMKKSILQYAIEGKLVEQRPEEGTAADLLKQIKAEKAKLIKEGKIKKEKPLPPITEDEIPFDIPENWVWCRLGDVIDVRDGTHETPKYYTSGVPLVTSKNISSGVITFDNVKYISSEDAALINTRSKVDDGDILFAMIGSIGNPVLVHKECEFCIKNVALFKRYSNRLSFMPYWFWFLKLAQEQLKCVASGGVQAFVSLKVFRQYIVPLPPLSEQHRIVAKLEQILSYIDKNTL